MDVWKRARAIACAFGPVAALALSPQGAGASGVDGAGRTIVVPLAFTGQLRESTFTLTNPNPEHADVTATYVGAEGTPMAASSEGVLECLPQRVPMRGSLTLRLRALCPDAFMQDRENYGYVTLVSSADARANIFVSTIVESMAVATGIDGQPLGDHDPGFKPVATLGLEVGGLRRRQNQRERPLCFLGTFGEDKKVALSLLDSGGAVLGSPTSRSLVASRMVMIDLESEFGLAPANEDDLRLVASSNDPGFLLLGCGGENRATNSIAYQPAQTPEPADRSRLHSVVVHAETNPGPFFVPTIWSHTLLGGATDSKVTLSTYVRPDDEVRCWIEPWPAHFPCDDSPYVELRVLDPQFGVIAGGSGVRDTGTFRTASRGRLSPAAGDRHVIEISYDEGSGWPHWPNCQITPGGWQVHCTSAAGMSEPIPVPVLYLDDF